MSKVPVSTGQIIQHSITNTTKDSFLLHINSGSLVEGAFIRTPDIQGTVTKVFEKRENDKNTWAKIELPTAQIKIPSSFEIFSTVNLTNISILFEFIFLFLIFFICFNHISKPLSRVPLIVLIVFALTWVVRNIVLNNLYTYSGFFNGAITIFIILFALIFFYYQLNKPENLFVYTSPSFWIISAILIYKAGTFFLFLYGNTLEQEEKLSFYMINTVFYIIENLLFAIAFLIKGKPLQANPKKI